MIIPSVLLLLFAASPQGGAEWPSSGYLVNLESDFNSRLGNAAGSQDYVNLYDTTGGHTVGERSWRVGVSSEKTTALAQTAVGRFKSSGVYFNCQTVIFSEGIIELTCGLPISEAGLRELMLLILLHEYEHTPDDDPEAPGGDDVPDKPTTPGTKEPCAHINTYINDAARACVSASIIASSEGTLGERCVDMDIICKFYDYIAGLANGEGDDVNDRCPGVDPNTDGIVILECQSCVLYFDQHPHCNSGIGPAYGVEESSNSTDNNYENQQILE